MKENEKNTQQNGNIEDDDFFMDGNPIVIDDSQEEDFEINYEADQNAPLKEEDLYFQENNAQNEHVLTDEEIDLGGNLNIGNTQTQMNQIEPEVETNPENELFQGILAEEGMDWDDMEEDIAEMRREERKAQQEKENQLKANLAAEEQKKKDAEAKKKEAEDARKKKAEEAKKKKEEEKKKKEEKEKERKEDEAPQRDFVTPYEQGTAEYESEQRGYKDHSFDEGFTSKQAKETHVMKYAAMEIFNSSTNFRWSRSADQKQLVNDLEAFDQYMKEIEGRTKLTPREMEVYDKLSLRLYKSGKEYREHMMQKIEKQKQAYDEKHKDDKNKMEFFASPEDNAKLEGTNKLLETIERMRKETFEKEMQEKEKELTEKCQKEAEKAESIRDQMEAVKDNPEAQKALQHNMEESIAQTLFYNNRIENLKKKGEFNPKPDESLPKAMERLNKATKPTPKELDEIKKGELCKTLVKQGHEKLKKGELLTTEDIKKSQQEYIKAEGNKRAMNKWREANMKKPEPQKTNEAQKQQQLNKPVVPGM